MTYFPKVYRKQGGAELVIASGGTLTFESGSTLTLPSNLRTGFIPLPLGAWRLIATNDIPAIAVASGNGGNLGSDTAPKFKRVNAATDKKIRIEWASSSSIEITQDFVYPPDLDDTATIVVHLLMAMAGTTDTPTIAVGYFEGLGDTNAGGNTAAVTGTTIADYSVTIAASDVGAYPVGASIALTPAAHTTDALYLYSSWATYTRKTN